MSLIKQFAESNLTKAQLSVFKTNTLKNLLQLTSSSANRIYYRGTNNLNQAAKLALFFDTGLATFINLSDIEMQHTKSISHSFFNK